MRNIPRLGKFGLCKNCINFENNLPIRFSHFLMTFLNYQENIAHGKLVIYDQVTSITEL